MKKYLLAGFFALISLTSFAQYKSSLNQQQWVDSVFNSLSDDEKIAQLMVIRAHSNLGPDHVAKVVNDIQKYNVGALCFFQGGPIRQANLTNYYQSIAKTPLMVTIDAEYGLGMRLDSVIKFPYQLTLGALNDPSLIYEMGKAVGEQCKRIGVQVNYAPVVDINNNPDNPVIGYRSFGEDKNKVTVFGVAYMKGMQDAGIMACAKHFPGHGDVDVDSHLDLPVINKSMDELDSMELVPFRALFDSGVGSVMIAHLSVPAIDNTEHVATSISKNTVTGLLRDSLHYNGITFTDALEMKGVAKYFPGGTIAVEALIAGNDMLCLPESVAGSIDAIKAAIADKRLSWDDIYTRVKKVLSAKYKLRLNQWKPIDTTNLLHDLNAKTDEIRYRAARQTITLVKNKFSKYIAIPKIAYVAIGESSLTFFGKALKERRKAETFAFSYKDNTAKSDSILQMLRSGNYDEIVVSVSGYSLRPGNNYGISEAAIDFFNQLQQFNTKNYVFGNVLAIKNFLSAPHLMACYQDDDITQYIAADLYAGDIQPKGKLPVSIGQFKYGYSAFVPVYNYAYSRFYQVDSIVDNALDKGAFPGCVVLAAKDGRIIYQKAFGHYQFHPATSLMTLESIFDLASVTKISATTISVMKLYEQGKIKLNKTLGDYLPWTKGTDKAHLKIEDILLHQAGLVPFIPFYKETIDSITGIPNPAIYANYGKPDFNIRVAENLYLRNDWNDTLLRRILKSPLGPSHKYVYSDNDFIFLGKIVETITGMTLDEYVQKTFYTPLGLATTGFKPMKRFLLNQVVPTEDEYNHFRRQLIWGDVDDEGSSMFGGVAGHAGLFSDAYDLSRLYQMLLNGGKLDSKRYLKEKTIQLFTAYHSNVSRRGYGFDKPEKPARLSQSGGDNATRPDPYPSALASPETFGHTGFTGTCVWVDPKYDIVYIFLSNRVNPTRDNNKISQLLIRGKILDAIYRALNIH
jgi:beta-N-acetylhexosaminidase